MTDPLSRMLREWPYEPGKLAVRLIEDEDGSRRLQVRVDLGLLQMETEGRPDGLRPGGYDSALDQIEARADEFEAERDAGEDDEADDDGGLSDGPIAGNGGNPRRPSRNGHSGMSEDGDSGMSGGASGGASGGGGSGGGFRLGADECRRLREEAAQYYHRYVALFAVEDFDGVVRDTTHALRIADFCARAAERDMDRVALEAHRPYVLMTRARALASQLVRDNEPRAALLAIDRGLEAVRGAYARTGRAEIADESSEVRLLEGMREALTPKLPVSQRSELEQRLRLALDHENYELAAILRDELRTIHPPGTPAPGSSPGGAPGTPGNATGGSGSSAAGGDPPPEPPPEPPPPKRPGQA